MKNALVISSRLSQLQNIDGMSMKGHPAPPAIDEPKEERMPNADAVFFNNLKSKCIVLMPLFRSSLTGYWRNFCFNPRRLTTLSASTQKTAFFRPHSDFIDSGRDGNKLG